MPPRSRFVALGLGLVSAVTFGVSSEAQLAGGQESATPAPRGPIPFSEEAIQRGLTYYTPKGVAIAAHGYGVGLVDLDGDGDLDVVACGAADGVVGLWENDGTGNFTPRMGGNGIPALAKASGVVALDYDGDGALDLYFAQLSAFQTGNVLVENLGNFQFQDVTATAGVGDPSEGNGCAVGDYDNDGWLDLYVSNYGLPNVLYHNEGDGTFTDQAPALGLNDPWRTLQAVFFDMDWDGDADLVLSNDKKDDSATYMKNRLFENVGGTFTDISVASGLDVNIYSMGVAVGDFDRNGLQDLYFTNVGTEPNALLLNQGSGLFSQDEVMTGTESYRTGWGAVFFDHDNDMHQELFVCNALSLTATGTNRFYQHDGSFPCDDDAAAMRLADSRDSLGVALGDVDGDGDQDLLVQNNDDNLRLFINRVGQKKRWIRFDVQGQDNNLFAIGAHVQVRVGHLWQHREILAGGNNYKSQNELVVHFGVGVARQVDEVIVTWPGGATSTLTNLATNQTWVIPAP